MYICVISLSCILESNHGVTYGPEGKYSIRVQQFDECINSGWVRAVKLSECRCFNRFQGLVWHRTHTLHIKCMCYTYMLSIYSIYVYIFRLYICLFLMYSFFQPIHQSDREPTKTQRRSRKSDEIPTHQAFGRKSRYSHGCFHPQR